MTRFHFNLDRVLHWRAIELASEEAKLKRLIDENRRIESQLDGIRNEINESPVRIAKLDCLCGNDLNQAAGYLVHLTGMRDRLSRLRGETQLKIAEQVEVHRKAKQRHKLLVELRGRRHSEWQMETIRQLDELAHESYLARWKAV